MANSLISNLFWKFAEQTSSQFVSFVISVILARLLAPADYGVIAMVAIFVSLTKVMVDGGLNSALIQKKDADMVDFSTVLYFTLGLSALFYLILFLGAPYVSAFYGKDYEILIPVLRVLGLQIFIYAFNSVQQAYVARKMMFKKFFWATLIGTIASGVIGIVLAYTGFGVWALVAQILTSAIANTIVLYAITKFLPRTNFSIERLKSLINYGYKVFGSSLLVVIFQEIRALIIGKVYSPSDLAFYDRGRQYPNLVVANANTSIGAVLFPKLALSQDNLEKVKQTTRNSIRVSSYILCPMLVLLAISAEPFVRLLLTDKWLPCVPLLQLFCVAYFFQPIHTANMQAIKAIGRSDILFKLELIKKTIEILSLLAVMWISVTAIVISLAVTTTFFTFINSYPNKKLLNYTYLEQLKDMMSPCVLSMIMAVPLILSFLFIKNDLTLIIVQVIIGIITYILLSILSNNKEFSFIWQTIRNIKK